MKCSLLALVFLTGAAVLVVEIAAIRILSPFFGNTVYTVSGVIGIILVALSFGYARGGKRADRMPTNYAFFQVIERAGLSLVLLFLIVAFFLPSLARLFPLTWGPLASAFILFFLPSYLLGMLSPFAIRLLSQAEPELGAGTISGKVFFWSTFGSIAGTLLTAFVLIPHLGLTAILFWTTTSLLLIGGIGSMREGAKKQRVRSFAILFIALLALGSAFFLWTRDVPHTVYSKDGVYEHLTIVDQTYAGRPARFFYQDRSSSGAMFLDGDDLVFPYAKYYALYKLLKPNVRQALFIGGGAYSMPAALHRDLPEAYIDIAEIEPSLYSLAQKYFHISTNSHLRNHVQDGRRFLEESKTQYDFIFSDVYYSLYSIPSHFTTKEFFTQAKQKLNSDGIFIANLIGSLSSDEPSFILSELRTFQTVFPVTYVFATQSPSIPGPQNIIIVGVNRDTFPSINWDAAPPPLPTNLLSHLVPLERYDVNTYRVLTDNYAPVDSMIAKLLRKQYPVFSVHPDVFRWNGNRALQDIEKQVSFGSRAMGAAGHDRAVKYIQEELKKTNAEVQLQQGGALTNIVGRFDPEKKQRILIGTHYDSIARAYRDKKNPDAFMPGANNGASGVALLLETARVLNAIERPSVGVDLVFFDGEEGEKSLGGGDSNWAPLGSPFFVRELNTFYPTQKPDAVAIFDMVCDRNLSLLREPFSVGSAPEQVQTFWEIGKVIAPNVFNSKELTKPIGDDHTAFAEAGIPSFLVIDFDYEPWFNTTGDTIDRCSTESLESVGRTLLQFLYTR